MWNFLKPSGFNDSALGKLPFPQPPSLFKSGHWYKNSVLEGRASAYAEARRKPRVSDMWVGVFIWSQWSDLNRRPTPYHGVALPAELHWHILSAANASEARIGIVFQTTVKNIRPQFKISITSFPVQIQSHLSEVERRPSDSLKPLGFKTSSLGKLPFPQPPSPFKSGATSRI